MRVLMNESRVGCQELGTNYSDNQKTLKCEDDFQTVDMTLNGLINMVRSNPTV